MKSAQTTGRDVKVETLWKWEATCWIHFCWIYQLKQRIQEKCLVVFCGPSFTADKREFIKNARLCNGVWCETKQSGREKGGGDWWVCFVSSLMWCVPSVNNYQRCHVTKYSRKPDKNLTPWSSSPVSDPYNQPVSDLCATDVMIILSMNYYCRLNCTTSNIYSSKYNVYNAVFICLSKSMHKYSFSSNMVL